MSRDSISQAVIVAGGKGTRLAGVLDRDTPKILAPVNGKPVLRYQIEMFRRFGVENILILGFHLIDQIIEYVVSSDFEGININFFKESSPRGTAGALYDAKDLLHDSFYLSYGDLVFDIDLGEMADRHKIHAADGALITLLLHRSNHPQDADLVEVDSVGNVCAFHSYPHANAFPNLTNSAIYILEKNALGESCFEQLGIVDFGRDIFPAFVAENMKIGSYLSTEYLIDVGVEGRFKEASADQQQGKPVKQRLSTPRNVKLLFVQYPFEANQALIDEVKRCNSRLDIVGIVIGHSEEVFLSDFSVELEFQLASLGCVVDLGVSGVISDETKDIDRMRAQSIVDSLQNNIFERLIIDELSFIVIEDGLGKSPGLLNFKINAR